MFSISPVKGDHKINVERFSLKSCDLENCDHLERSKVSTPNNKNKYYNKYFMPVKYWNVEKK